MALTSQDDRHVAKSDRIQTQTDALDNRGKETASKATTTLKLILHGVKIGDVVV